MKNLYIFLFILIGLTSCSDDDGLTPNPFVISFAETSTNYATIQPTEQIQLIFSEPAKNSGYVVIELDATAEYGIDYTTSLDVENRRAEIPFFAGDNALSFQFTNLIEDFNPALDQDKKIEFKIVEINYTGAHSIQGYTTHLVSFNVKLGGSEQPEVGGPNEPNQVYFDLSTGEYKLKKRDEWDLGFYSGEEFRVILNGSIYMATKSLGVTDIDAITQTDIPSNYFTEVAIGTFNPDNEEYVDNPSGNINQTAIQEIAVDATGNQVYLLNLGFEVGTSAPNVGSVNVAGDARGWKKIRVLRQDNGYLLQYADLTETTHQEIFIPKRPEYNFNHFSFNANDIVDVQPPKNEWDLCFTVFTNVIEGAGSYGYSDMVLNNLLGGAKAFMVEGNSDDYQNYELNEVEATSLLLDDQRAIGSEWRNVFQHAAYADRFFVLKDTEGYWYKIRFLALVNENGERGFPKFEYELLQQENNTRTQLF